MSEEINYKTDVPKGWALINFSDTCDSISLNGIKIKQKQYQQKGKYPVVDQGQELIGGYYDKDELAVSGEPPFIIFGDHTKVKKLVNFKFIAGADGVKVLKPYEFLNPKLFFHFMHCIKLPDRGYARHYQFLGKAEFPIPPLHEQQRIVSKIEELFSSLDKGIESLKTAQAQLKVYRQAVLKWAFEGKLTNDNVKEGELPKGWEWIKIEQLLFHPKKGMATGPFGTALKKEEHKETGIPVLGIENIGEGKFQMPNKIYVTESKAEDLKAFVVFANDIIISRSGTVGEICCVPPKMENSLISTNLIRVRLNQIKISSKYFVFLFQGGAVRDQVRELCKGSTRAFLNQTILNSLKFPFCKLPEQEEIIQEIEFRLSVCDKIEESISTSLLQAEALRQSILKKAFEGKLVAQDPNDEPASVLLDRIKAEKEKNKSVKKVKEKKAKLKKEILVNG